MDKSKLIGLAKLVLILATTISPVSAAHKTGMFDRYWKWPVIYEKDGGKKIIYRKFEDRMYPSVQEHRLNLKHGNIKIKPAFIVGFLKEKTQFPNYDGLAKKTEAARMPIHLGARINSQYRNQFPAIYERIKAKAFSTCGQCHPFAETSAQSILKSSSYRPN